MLIHDDLLAWLGPLIIYLILHVTFMNMIHRDLCMSCIALRMISTSCYLPLISTSQMALMISVVGCSLAGLTKLFNLSLSSAGKIAIRVEDCSGIPYSKIISIFNFHPISLLCIASKLLEKHVQKLLPCQFPDAWKDKFCHLIMYGNSHNMDFKQERVFKSALSLTNTVYQVT